MAETKNQEWNISHTTAPQDSSTAQPTTNTEWNVDQPTAAQQQSAAQPTSQQWNIEAQQWDVNQPVVPQKEQQEIKEQWNMSEPAAQLESSPQPPDALWDVAQPEPSPKSNEPTSQLWSIDQPPPSQGVVPPQKDETPPTPPQPQTTVTEKPSLQSASKVTDEPVNEQEKQPVIAQPKPAVVMPQEKPTTPEVKDAQSAVVTTQPQAPQRTVVQSSSQQEPVVPKQPVPPPATVTETVAQPMPPKQPVVAAQQMVAQPVIPKQPAAPQETVNQPLPPKQPVVAVQQPVVAKTPTAQATVTPPTVPQQPNVSQATVVQPMAPIEPKQQTASKQTVMQQITPQNPTPQTRTVVQSTTQVSMQPKTSHQSVAQRTQQSSNAQPKQPMAAQATVTQPTVAQAAPPPASTPPVVKPKPSSTDNQGQMRKGGAGDEITLEQLQKGVFWLAPDLEGWVDKTKALKEEFRRQSDANEMYFVKNLPHLDVKALNISEDPSKYIYNVQDMRGVEVINLLRCVINEYREFESGPFFFQFGGDKKIKLELLPTATQPGNGLIKTVGRRKYYSYPDMCSMLQTAGVNSKGLGIMLQKLNTSGLKSALNNKISPINELHFMLLFEVARRLVRGPHGFSMASEPEIDQLPIGIAVSRMITMFCKGNYCLNYEAVFGTQDKYNPFIDTSVVLRRQKIYALNKLFYDAEIRPQAGDNPFLAKFLKYHNGYIIKTVNGFMEELDMAFRGF